MIYYDLKVSNIAFGERYCLIDLEAVAHAKNFNKHDKAQELLTICPSDYQYFVHEYLAMVE